MDFLDSLDLDSVNKKCNRVRSWYLYEQYKSLEENQLDAALRLKNKAYQDKILKQELSERRARRRLCDQFGLCQSESRLGKSVCSVPSQNPGNDELFESFCEIYEEYELENFEDTISHNSQVSKDIEDFTNVTQSRDGYADSVNNIGADIKNRNSAANIRNELETVKQNIAETINLQLETAKENIECLENFAKLIDDKELPGDNLLLNKHMKIYASDCHKFNPNHENSITAVWSKLVDFAYNIINLNHGNCYYDYSSQLFTAVLTCDFLLRVINRVCHIMRPYVTPVKYCNTTSNSETSLVNLSNENRKILFNRINRSVKEPTGNTKKYCKKPKNYYKNIHSENNWCNCCKDSLEDNFNEMKYCGASDPLPRTKYTGKKFKCLENVKFLQKNVCKCRRLTSIVNSMLQFTRDIEKLLQDIAQ